MEETKVLGSEKITKELLNPNNPVKLLLSVFTAAVVLGTLTGYIISQKSTTLQTPGGNLTVTTAKNAQADTKTFKDFAEGTIKAKPQVDEYAEGTHTLIRESAVPVALTSSVVDLSKYEGKKVKVFGETQKALKEGWLMDVGKVEEIK